MKVARVLLGFAISLALAGCSGNARRATGELLVVCESSANRLLTLQFMGRLRDHLQEDGIEHELYGSLVPGSVEPAWMVVRFELGMMTISTALDHDGGAANFYRYNDSQLSDPDVFLEFARGILDESFDCELNRS